MLASLRVIALGQRRSARKAARPPVRPGLPPVGLHMGGLLGRDAGVAAEAGGHDYSTTVAPAELPPAVAAEIEALQAYQQAAAVSKMSHAVEARTLLDLGRYGVISTLGRDGYPGGAVVGFATDSQGRPILSLSSMSAHTGDLRADPRASITVTATGFQGAADARVSITGDLTVVPAAEAEAARAVYTSKHADAYWVNFGDFTLFRMDGIKTLRLVGGFARAGRVTPAEYQAAAPDPVAQFGPAVASHMNSDHGAELLAMCRHYSGVATLEGAVLLGLDGGGMDVGCSHRGNALKLRLTFPVPAKARKDIKENIVIMTRESMGPAK